MKLKFLSNIYLRLLKYEQEMCDYNWQAYNYDKYNFPQHVAPPGQLLTYPIQVQYRT